MVEVPIETIDEERLVPLRVRDDEFQLDVTRPVRTEDASAGEPGDVAETAIELTPVRFSDGTPIGGEPFAESSLDSDLVVVQPDTRDEGAAQPET